MSRPIGELPPDLPDHPVARGLYLLGTLFTGLAWLSCASVALIFLVAGAIGLVGAILAR